MDEHSTVGDVYDAPVAAEGAIEAFRDAHFDLSSLSIVGTNSCSDEDPAGLRHVAEGVLLWGKHASFWAKLWGWLAGADLVLVPGVGQVIVLGPLAGALMQAIDGPMGIEASNGPIAAALVRVGIAAGSAARYETAVRAGKFVITVRGSFTEIDRARRVLANGALQAEIYAVV